MNKINISNHHTHNSSGRQLGRMTTFLFLLFLLQARPNFQAGYVPTPPPNDDYDPLSSVGYIPFPASDLSISCTISEDNHDITTLLPLDEINNLHSFPLFMTLNEQILFSSYLSESKIYYEYGTGGSTLYACSLSHLHHILSIESDQNYLQDLINSSNCLQENMKTQRFLPVYANIGPTQAFGYPITNEQVNPHFWSIYPESIVKLVKLYQHIPDFVLIDGRFRVASALMTLLVLPYHGLIAVHDFFPRKQYYSILKYYDTIDCIETLLIAKQKENINWTEFYLDLNHHFADPE